MGVLHELSGYEEIADQFFTKCGRNFSNLQKRRLVTTFYPPRTQSGEEQEGGTANPAVRHLAHDINYVDALRPGLGGDGAQIHVRQGLP